MSTYKLSYYTILTEPINESGHRILFSTRSGKTLVIPALCHEFLTTDRCDAIPAEVLTKLRRMQAVVPAAEDELAQVVRENQADIEAEQSQTLYEVIQPAAMCQLGCYYCGQQHSKDYLDPGMTDQILARIRQKAARGSFRKLYIGWFGAEPLMAIRQMRELTPRLKALAAEFGMSYGAKIVTNGLSLKENVFVELTRQMHVDSFEVTLDGVAAYHDRHRYTKEGGASFDLIFNNLSRILNRPDYSDFGCGISIRCNVDEDNIEGVTPLIHLLAEHGLQRKISYFYPIGIYAWGNDAHKKSLTKEAFARYEMGWIAEMLRLGFPYSRVVPGRVKKVCMAVSKSSEMYDAFGNVFNCTEVSYVPQYEGTDYVLGRVNDPALGFGKKRPLADWNDTLLTDRFPCHTCKMLPVCGGGCPKSWHEDMRACPTPKFNIKDRLLLTYAMGKGPGQGLEERLENFWELYETTHGERVLV